MNAKIHTICIPVQNNNCGSLTTVLCQYYNYYLSSIRHYINTHSKNIHPSNLNTKYMTLFMHPWCNLPLFWGGAQISKQFLPENSQYKLDYDCITLHEHKSPHGLLQFAIPVQNNFCGSLTTLLCHNTLYITVNSFFLISVA